MNDAGFKGGDAVDIIGGKYRGRHGKVDRLAGSQSIKIAIKTKQQGRTDYVTIRRYNVMRAKDAERKDNKGGEESDSNKRDTIDEMVELTRAMGNVASDITDLSKKMAALTERMVRLKMAQEE
jgi:hypothetical protein